MFALILSAIIIFPGQFRIEKRERETYWSRTFTCVVTSMKAVTAPKFPHKDGRCLCPPIPCGSHVVHLHGHYTFGKCQSIDQSNAFLDP